MVDADDCDAREVDIVAVDLVFALDDEAVVVAKEVLKAPDEGGAALLSQVLCILVPWDAHFFVDIVASRVKAQFVGVVGVHPSSSGLERARPAAVRASALRPHAVEWLDGLQPCEVLERIEFILVDNTGYGNNLQAATLYLSLERIDFLADLRPVCEDP